ncbi:MAG: hypothetical protein UV64_C0014G0005 [Parcubacteria group bacterium GW2011_GWC1_43_11b]|uniref:Uncharacterized protein n=2 Tax=Candidatus Vogeliibacteriota TaxID=1817922 RepID=A0A1G2QD78_9BACT|nr:MAG: hypothetical protein UV50_C0004G0010 [Parcubacteria group bacterium GW2011_GWB1_42_9]KKS89015.1 MAG: hypothetical protein UV64_C0014G0005 [Parcubacteria group bacterium GW2011_GWC1_43_11b]KKT10005.1 MAG: hypothetical protein UV88_C0003G0007 [Parcubacteria group bacterium GW2011_GWA1_43_21]OHA58373.1 MAG: hypothetical protein A2370_01510 [Candidatus Vogelbacteria bacterium RIFOXYB1_FULL_42_16]OHA60570.1 MAG: hypothetical protein A2607_00800 [Candidatus Vogelbacteria bacterium RIFOXYD1_FU
MKNNLLIPITIVFKRFFFTFLDISGILLGFFLTGLGVWIVTGRIVAEELGYLIAFLGVSAFFIHAGHYFNLAITRWIFGSGSYFHKDQDN